LIKGIGAGHSRPFLFRPARHPELVSGSMIRPFQKRRAKGKSAPWMLKQVQHDGV
jgi:hypothetical protein